MTDAVASRAARSVVSLAGAALLSLAGCASLAPPNASDISGLSPSGTVTVSETFVAGLAKGDGTLTYQGQTYPFSLLGSIMGPGGGLARIDASGEVYKLASLSEFGGLYTQGNGPPGLDTSNAGDLWLKNRAGVIMHLTGRSSGAMLSLGRDEIYIRMSQ